LNRERFQEEGKEQKSPKTRVNLWKGQATGSPIIGENINHVLTRMFRREKRVRRATTYKDKRLGGPGIRMPRAPEDPKRKRGLAPFEVSRLFWGIARCVFVRKQEGKESEKNPGEGEFHRDLKEVMVVHQNSTGYEN